MWACKNAPFPGEKNPVIKLFLDEKHLRLDYNLAQYLVVYELNNY